MKMHWINSGKEISDLINFDKRKKGFYEGMEDFAKKNKNFEGYLKEYINGKITADELLKKYNSMNNGMVDDFTQMRKSVGGSMNKFKKFNSFNNSNFIGEDVNNLLRGSMAMPLRKKYSLDNDQIIIDDKKKREEIKEVDEEELLSG